MTGLRENFASAVFNDNVMKERLPKSAYTALRQTIDHGDVLLPEVADVVAAVMKQWAIEKGATHYTHWFQPLSGATAEKHESFLSVEENENIITEFSGKKLIKGESDASSFPSGGLRATFEARGYTAWDCTSPAFVKDSSLYIPTAFCSYNGEALDKKTPLLRSMQVLSDQALRLLRIFGDHETRKVTATVGAEQEYFLVDKKIYDKRMDLIYTGRTLFGSNPAKGQEMDDHYYGVIDARISAFMKDMDEELWKLGVLAKTKHNEAAPAQHEIVPLFSTVNIATDHNQLIMETLKKVALKHNLVCLLHEKPFAGINGSGKHNNWSLTTDKGQNLFEAGNTPAKNIQFLTFLCAVLKAVDKYAELIRCSAANPGNDLRLGMAEAPPAVISVYLGKTLTDVLLNIESGNLTGSLNKKELKISVNTLPDLPMDDTDRNRTSPFAFTGNKFEFRMVASSASIATPNFIINTVVADVLSEFADRLENKADLEKEVQSLLKETIKNHKKIIFNGNGYSEEWVKEAVNVRGLPNIESTAEANRVLLDEKSIVLMEKHNVLSRAEMVSRYEIYQSRYIKTINLEARAMLEMTKRFIMPAVAQHISQVSSAIINIKKAAENSNIKTNYLEENLSDCCEYLDLLSNDVKRLDEVLETAVSETKKRKQAHYKGNDIWETYTLAAFYRDEVAGTMNQVRHYSDKLEKMVDGRIWPFPTYGNILFNIT